jgi:hypothetical protein
MVCPDEELPVVRPTAATLPAAGLVSVAAERFCSAAVTCDCAASIAAWSAAIWAALAGWAVVP